MPTIRIDIKGIQIALGPIADDNIGGSRHEREQEAVASLVPEIYGKGASKHNKDNGEPYISNGNTVLEPCSISHCHSHAIVAKAPHGCRIGVDIEVFRPQLQRVASRFLNTDEQRLYASDKDMLLAAWTIKEAVYKAAGLTPLPLTDIHLPSGIGSDTKNACCRIPGGIQFKILYCGYILPNEGVFMTLVEQDAPQP